MISLEYFRWLPFDLCVKGTPLGLTCRQGGFGGLILPKWRPLIDWDTADLRWDTTQILCVSALGGWDQPGRP